LIISQPKRIAARVTEAIDHAPGLRTLVLAPDGPVPRFKPGQFLHLAIEVYDPSAHWPESRIFSIASAPEELDRLRITFSAVGVFTRRMMGLAAGDVVWVKLPYGDFVVETGPDRPAVLVAGGTGITPFVSLLSSPRVPVGPLTVLYGARRPELLIYRGVLEDAARRWPQFRWSGFTEEGAGLQLVTGRLSVEAALTAARGLGDAGLVAFYLSGPHGMISVFQAGLSAVGVAPEMIRVDAWE
jgi:ferredoxin-NADP reductase